MVKFTDEQLALLHLCGIPKDTLEIINDYLPDEDDPFGKNFGSSSPYKSTDPKRYFKKAFDISAKKLNIKLDIATHAAGDCYVVNPDVDFKLKYWLEDVNFKNFYLVPDCSNGRYVDELKVKTKDWMKKWNWILTK